MCELFGVVDGKRAAPCELGVKDEQLLGLGLIEYGRNDIFTRGSISWSRREQSCWLVQGAVLWAGALRPSQAAFLPFPASF